MVDHAGAGGAPARHVVWEPPHRRHGEGMFSACAEAKTQEAIQALARIGFRVRSDPAVVSRLVQLGKRMEQLEEKTE